MALSVLTAPSGTAVFTPEYFTIQESSGGIYNDANFKFIAVVKDGSGNQLAKLRFPIYPGQTNKGVISVNRILEAQVDNFFDLVSTGVTNSADPIIEYEVEWGKEYGTPVTEYLNETNSTGRFHNAACDVSVDLIEQWLISTSQRKIHENEQSWLYYNHGATVALVNHVIRYTSYDSSGNVLSTVEVEYTPTAKQQHKFPVGANTSSVPSGVLYTGSLPLIAAGASYYTIQYLTDAGSYTEIIPAIRYDIDTTCSQYDGYTICWLNSRGGFDSWYFQFKRINNYQIERRTVKTSNYEFSGNRYAQNEQKHTKKSFFTRVMQRATINSGNLTTADAAFLKELFTSPVVYILENDTYYPVNILNDTYEQKTNINDDVFNIKVDIEYSEPDNLQRL